MAAPGDLDSGQGSGENGDNLILINSTVGFRDTGRLGTPQRPRTDMTTLLQSGPVHHRPAAYIV
jgi:hypothetical protein